MGPYWLVELFAREILDTTTLEALQAALEMVCDVMGFSYYAFAHHIDVRRAGIQPLLLHNYPTSWADYYAEHDLGRCDPVRRQSHRTNRGFSWSAAAKSPILTPADRAMLEAGEKHGLGAGFTVPGHIPGVVSGSCTFVVLPGQSLPDDQLYSAQLIGQLAFDQANQLSGGIPLARREILTDQQRECLCWASLGKTDWEISRIMDIARGTVVQHMKNARERLGVGTRTALVSHSLRDGIISLYDVFRVRRRF
jgi:LuxR family quorum-sensing system transcriptional regulator CciR